MTTVCLLRTQFIVAGSDLKGTNCQAHEIIWMKLQEFTHRKEKSRLFLLCFVEDKPGP